MATLCLLNVMAQEKKTITGVVQDSKGAAVEGATITESGTRNTVVTKSDGSFTISVKENATLVISSIGFEEVQLKTGSASSYTISLQEKVSEVSEVVVTAVGISKESKKVEPPNFKASKTRNRSPPCFSGIFCLLPLSLGPLAALLTSFHNAK